MYCLIVRCRVTYHLLAIVGPFASDEAADYHWAENEEALHPFVVEVKKMEPDWSALPPARIKALITPPPARVEDDEDLLRQRAEDDAALGYDR